MKKRFVVTGANFMNKGAQSMLLISVYELRRIFPECEVFAVLPDSVQEKCKFDYRSVSASMWEYAAGGWKSILAVLKTCVKRIMRKRERIADLKEFKSFLSESTAIIDISGYALTSQMNYKKTTSYLAVIEAARKCQTSIILMPQSFGPFDYGKRRYRYERILRKDLAYPKMIFAREESGYELLTERLKLKNVKKSVDLVLQNRSFDVDAVFSEYALRDFESKIEKHSVAILPNIRAFERDSSGKLLSLYKTMVEFLLKKGRRVYLLSHSSEDYDLCKKIDNMFVNDERVVLLDELSCIEYSKYVSRFDYIIAARFHSIVHAYREAVPAIVFGWAEKYRSLVRLFDQEQYLFDVRECIEEAKLLNAIDCIDAKAVKEHMHLLQRLPEYQINNCFEDLLKLI